MFGNPKPVSLIRTREQYDRKIMIILIIICIISYFLFQSFLPFILLAAFFIIKRLFFSKLYFSPGDNIYIYGEQGSGKTLFITKLAEDNKQRYSIIVNSELDSLKAADAIIDRDEIGIYDSGQSAYFIDENSFAGFDNRSWSTNFTESSLDYLKKIRHYDSVLIVSSQAFGEVDKKLRDGVLKRVYHVKNCGWYSKAELLIKNDDSISDVDGSPLVSYRYPGLLDRLFDPTSCIYIRHKKYGSLVNSYDRKRLQILPSLLFNEKYERSLPADRFFPID